MDFSTLSPKEASVRKWARLSDALYTVGLALMAIGMFQRSRSVVFDIGVYFAIGGYLMNHIVIRRYQKQVSIG